LVSLPLPLFASLLATAALVACGSGGDGSLDGLEEVDNGFESDDPSGQSAAARGGSSSGGADAGAASAAPSANGGAKSSDDAQRAVEEADILKVDGTRLYALSRYGGLAIVDVSDPDHMKLLGRKRTDGIPFEMYVRNGRAYVMMNEYGKWVRGDGSRYGKWIQTSELFAFDVANPQAITEVSHYDVPGTISDSRTVGDVLYLVTNENGYCWGCGERAGTIVTSFDVASGAFAKVDQLDYRASDNTYSSWQRSVSATNERLYIAGPRWDWRQGQSNASSIIQVVDVTDPKGKLVKGADVPVSGQINSRWQMDESDGVLRVVSQYGNGWSGPNGTINPRVETFKIGSAQQFTKLGGTELILTKPESLRSVRFDGTRAYAITAERTDPLFTIDLSDPAKPKQAAALEIPGWIFHMEPRGDRLVGFGYDAPQQGGTPLAVTLFDVSDLSKPKELSRVTFGTGWSQLAEDQDRIHKSVRVLDDKGLVLVPFASSGRFWNNGCDKGQSGIQLIDFSRDALALRGVAPQWGMPRRALLAGERLLAVSDRNVTSFDITSRDAPAKKSELDLSNPAYRLVELPNHVASITNDWWTSEVMLSVTPKANADDADVSGKISLAQLADPDPSLCSNQTSAWTAWYAARLFATNGGSTVTVVVPRYAYTYHASGGGQNTRSGKVIVATIDVSNPAAPKFLAKTEIPLTERSSQGYWGYWGDGFWDGWGFWSTYGGSNGSLMATGQGALMVGDKLAYLEVDQEPYEVPALKGGTRWETRIHRKLHVVDLTNAAAPALAAPVELAESLGTTPLHVWNGSVITSRWVQSQTNPDKVRFFLDRIDLTGATPKRLPSLNTPGSILLADEASQRIVTTDYRASRAPAKDWQACRDALGYRAWFDYDTETCVSVARDFKLSDVQGTRVKLRQTFTPPSQNISGVQIADDRIYVTRYAQYDWSTSGAPRADGTYPEPALLEDGGLWAIGGVRAGQIGIVSQLTGDAKWPLAASGTKVALYEEGGLAIYDTAAPTAALVKGQNLRGYGYSSHVLMSADRAICSLGDWGLQTVTY
jgi:hypothetical protein